MDELTASIRGIVKDHLTKMDELSVYDQNTLIEKGKMLAELQDMASSIDALQQLVKEETTHQKQGLEKYMREAEESFNAVRQNIYNAVPEKPMPKQIQESPRPAPVVKSHTPSPTRKYSQKNSGGKKSTPNSSPATKSDWITVVKGGKKRAPPRSIENIKIINHEVAPDVFIKAYTISTLDMCHRFKGWWCYCPSVDRFCISINHEVICGTASVIRPVSKTPKKFSEDRRSESMDWRQSNYYIPRERNPSSRDTREFTNKMKFVPASQTPKKYEAYCYRLGSKDTLRDDVVSLKAEDYRLFADLTSNFLLCWTVASQEMRRRQATGMK
jgi:hypothetical protein